MAITEKKTGEKYPSKKAMMSHEKREGMKERYAEYGKKAGMKKAAPKSKSKPMMKAIKKK